MGRLTRPLAGVGGLLAVAAVIATGLVGRPENAAVSLVAGSAWLPSSVGQVALMSGSSGQEMAALRVAARGDDLQVAQAGNIGYAVDRSVGTVTRVDAATFAQSAPVRFAPDGPGRLSVLLGGGQVFVLDGTKGLLYRVDPASLAVVGTPRVLQATITADSAVVDTTGRLWVADDSSGALKWFDSASGSRVGAAPAGSRLVLAAGSPVLVGPRGADWLDRSGNSAAHVDFGLRSGESAQVAGTADGRLTVVVAGRGVVELCARSGCDTAFPIDHPGRQLGPAVLDQGLLFVPDLTAGSVHIVDTATAREVATPTVLTPSADFDLLPWEGQLFYNDPGTDRAGVLRLDGTVLVGRKYQPDNPDASVVVAASSATVPSVAPSIPATSSTPSTSSTPPRPSSSTPPIRSTPSRTSTSILLPVVATTPPPTTTATSATTPPAAPPPTTPPPTTPPPTTPPPTTPPPATPPGTTPPGTTPPATTPPVTTPPGTPPLSPPTVGAIAISGGSGGSYHDGDTLTFSVRTRGGPVTSWSWAAFYATDTGVPQTQKASGSGSTFSVPVDSGGSSGQEWAVRVTARNAAGQDSSSTTFLVVMAAAARTGVSDVQLSPDPAAPGAAVSMQATITGADPACTWKLGGTTAPCTQSIAAPSDPGAYPATVTVIDIHGGGQTAEATLTVGAPPTITDVDCPDGHNVKEALTCTATVTGSGLHWAWSVTPGGDTGTSANSFTFTPMELGQHTATLTLRNPFGSATTSSNSFLVVDGTPPTGAISYPSGYVKVTVTDPESGIDGGNLSVVFESRCHDTVIETYPTESADIPSDQGTTASAQVAYPFAGGSCVVGTGKFRQTYPVVVVAKTITASAYDGEGLDWNYSGP